MKVNLNNLFVQCLLIFNISFRNRKLLLTLHSCGQDQGRYGSINPNTNQIQVFEVQKKNYNFITITLKIKRFNVPATTISPLLNVSQLEKESLITPSLSPSFTFSYTSIVYITFSSTI